MINTVLKPSYLIVSDFLDWENEQELKHELIDGEIIAMTGEIFAHARLITRLVTKVFVIDG